LNYQKLIQIIITLWLGGAFDSFNRISTASKKRSCKGKAIFHHWRCLCCNSLFSSPGRIFLLYFDSSTMAAHILLQYLGQECRSKESNFLVKFGLGSWQMEPAWSGVGNCLWLVSSYGKYVSQNNVNSYLVHDEIEHLSYTVTILLNLWFNILVLYRYPL